MKEDSRDLTTLAGLEAAILHHEPGERHNFTTLVGTHCPQCGGDRRMNLSALYWQDLWAPHKPAGSSFDGGVMRTGATALEVSAPRSAHKDEYPAVDDPGPAVYAAVCVQCDHMYVLVVHRGPDGMELAALPSSYGGLATPKTHPAVAYYLDQAHRARSVGALSAAASMYRAALDQLLHHEGYANGTLGRKINDLENADPAPDWYADLNNAYLRVINALGSGAIHPNDGDIDKQRVIDRDLTEAVDALFTEILDLVYERPAKRRDRLDAAQKAAAVLSKHQGRDSRS
jgi:hypothetical protein